MNKVAIKNKYHLPRINDLMDQLVGACVFNKIDLISGYHQIRVTVEDILKTAFRNRYGHYVYLVMSVGLSNAPSMFMGYMDRIGHVIFNGGIIVGLSKVDAMLQWEAPKFVTDIRSLLWLVGYYRIFIEGFSKLALCFTQLTRKGQAYMWEFTMKRVFKSSRRS